MVNLFTLSFANDFYISYSLYYFSNFISLTHKQTSSIDNGRVFDGYKIIQINNTNYNTSNTNLQITKRLYLIFCLECEDITFYFYFFFIFLSFALIGFNSQTTDCRITMFKFLFVINISFKIKEFYAVYTLYIIRYNTNINYTLYKV